MRMAVHAVDEHELVYNPADGLDRIFLDASFGVKQCDVRRELPPCEALQTLPGERGAERAPEQSHPLKALVPDKHEWAITRPALKARRAIEAIFERWALHRRRSLA